MIAMVLAIAAITRAQSSRPLLRRGRKGANLERDELVASLRDWFKGRGLAGGEAIGIIFRLIGVASAAYTYIALISDYPRLFGSARSVSAQQRHHRPIGRCNVGGGPKAAHKRSPLGGPLGGGFAAPPVDTNVLGYDWTAPFRERVGVCSKRPDGVEPGDKFSIKIRISFNRDGTLASQPRLLVPAPSAKQRAFMLPPEKYKQWKPMEFYVTPLFTAR